MLPNDCCRSMSEEERDAREAGHCASMLSVTLIYLLYVFWFISVIIVLCLAFDAVKYGTWGLLMVIIINNYILVYVMIDLTIFSAATKCECCGANNSNNILNAMDIFLGFLGLRNWPIGIVFVGLLGNLLFCPESGMLSSQVGFYNTLFYYWAVINFQLSFACYLSVFIVIFDYIFWTLHLGYITTKNATMHCLLSIPMNAFGFYVDYFECFKFNWKYYVDIYINNESNDLQRASNPTISTSTYCITLFMAILYVLVFIYLVKIGIYKFQMKQEQRKKQVHIEIPVTATVYYQAVPLSV